MYYRVLSGTRGIYAAIDADCPAGDSRRNTKPDGSWLKKVGNDYLGAVSLWTGAGMRKYIDSGLFAWHVAVVKEDVVVQLVKLPAEILYEDDLQVICKPEGIRPVGSVPFEEFLQGFQELSDESLNK